MEYSLVIIWLVKHTDGVCVSVSVCLICYTRFLQLAMQFVEPSQFFKQVFYFAAAVYCL